MNFDPKFKSVNLEQKPKPKRHSSRFPYIHCFKKMNRKSEKPKHKKEFFVSSDCLRKYFVFVAKTLFVFQYINDKRKSVNKFFYP